MEVFNHFNANFYVPWSCVDRSGIPLNRSKYPSNIMQSSCRSIIDTKSDRYLGNVISKLCYSVLWKTLRCSVFDGVNF